ncbi:MAG: clostripain-related cysteine peptidase [Syntrophales bacterium]
MSRKTIRLRFTTQWFTLAIFIMLSAILSCSSSSDNHTPTTTILIYIEGTNLESEYSQATGNLKEMLAAVPASHLNVVLATGAAGKAVATDPVRSWRTVKRHLIKGGTIQELQDLGAVNMGNTAVLTDFIRWGQTTFPADKYILIFWDHGGGTLWGYGGDLDTDTDPMHVEDLGQAIRAAVATTGKRFDLIGFDACLMATAEIAANLAPYANYLVASEELEPGQGWNYTSFLNALAVNPHADGLAVGVAIANGYAAKTDPETDDYTLSVIDLSRIDVVVTAVQEFSSLAADQFARFGRVAWNQLATIRNLADEFGANYVNGMFKNMTDLAHFSSLLGERSEIYRQSAARMQEAVAQAVAYNVKGTGHASVGGLSFYFPFHKFDSEQSDFNRYEAVPFSPAYTAFLKPFIAYPLDNPPGALLQITDPVAEPAALHATATSPFGLAEQFITIAQVGSKDIYTMLGMDLATAEYLGEDRFDLSYARDNRWFTVDGHHVTVFFEHREQGGDTYALAVAALYRPKGTGIDKNQPVNLDVRYDYATNSGVIRTAWGGLQPFGMASRIQVDLNIGDIITPIFLTVDISTTPETITYSYGTPFELSDEKLIFKRSPIDTGTYLMLFQVRDLANNFEISNPFTFSVGSTGKQIAMNTEMQQAKKPKLPPSVLQQGFWNGWKP